MRRTAQPEKGWGATGLVELGEIWNPAARDVMKREEVGIARDR